MRRKLVISFGKKQPSTTVSTEHLSTHAPSSHYQAPQDHTETFRQLWAELHTKADPTQDWFASWLNRIPCGTCRSTARRIMDQIKPRYGDWFAFSVELHNAVNAKLNKPQLTTEEAAIIWRK